MYYTMFMEHNTKLGEKEEKKERLLFMVVMILSYLIDFLWLSFYSGIGYGLSIFLSYIELAAKLPIALIAISKYLDSSKGASFSQNFHEFKDDVPF